MSSLLSLPDDVLELILHYAIELEYSEKRASKWLILEPLDFHQTKYMRRLVERSITTYNSIKRTCFRFYKLLQYMYHEPCTLWLFGGARTAIYGPFRTAYDAQELLSAFRKHKRTHFYDMSYWHYLNGVPWFIVRKYSIKRLK